MAEITGFRYLAPLSHSGRLHINLCEKIIKGLFLSSQSFSSSALENTPTQSRSGTRTCMRRIEKRGRNVRTDTPTGTHTHTHRKRIDRTFNKLENTEGRIVSGQVRQNHRTTSDVFWFRCCRKLSHFRL